jgi:trans-AT polyketide synthase/acyltransferase/oxidoreductase domain-containing protein
MGAGLFELFPAEVEQADQVLGYSIRQLCLEDPRQELDQTKFTQPALYVVNALSLLKKIQDTGLRPNFVAGHSLGEYNALLAADVFNFVTGLKLVKQRGLLMSRASGGAMAAVLGLTIPALQSVLAAPEFSGIDIANLNSPAQVVISGPTDQINAVKAALEAAGARLVIPLKVSAAFHSRYMKHAADEFRRYLDAFSFSAPRIPVIANVSAAPYDPSSIKDNLARQISSSVRWTDSVNYLLRQPEPQFEEIGPGAVLTGLIRQIKAAATPK